MERASATPRVVCEPWGSFAKRPVLLQKLLGEGSRDLLLWEQIPGLAAGAVARAAGGGASSSGVSGPAVRAPMSVPDPLPCLPAPACFIVYVHALLLGLGWGHLPEAVLPCQVALPLKAGLLA